MVEYEAMEKAIMCQVAGKLISAMPEDERKKILEASLEKSLTEMFRPWNIEKYIKADADKYMAEYIQTPKVQTQIKEATIKAVDKLMNGVIEAVVIASQDTIKSNYRKFVELPKEQK